MTRLMGRTGSWAFAWSLLTVGVASAGAPARPVGYNRDVRPLLADNCFACHGPDKNNRKGKLRLDDRDVAQARGSIVPGQPGKSELVTRIFSEDPEEVMPPPRSHKTLKKEEKELLKRWIAEGAVYEPYWAYVLPTRPAVPKVQDSPQVRTPIDAFVLQKLERRNILPSPEAGRQTLLRRLSLDLIGLPPTAAEVEAFVNDTDPRAYEKQVDRLLASRHYGERMAVPWLDLVRYADTVGFHGDQVQRIFPYRDYVIDAFNTNKPFDKFTVEQLAGDLLPHPTPEQLVATGFNRLNMMTREGGAQPKEYLARYAADRVRTLGTAWLGATLGCCECHDHKFDPFTSKDFYQLEAFFADIQQWGVYQDYDYTPNPDLRGWSNDHPFPPEIQVVSPALVKRMDVIRQSVHDLYATTAMPRAENERAAWARWQDLMRGVLSQHKDGWLPLAPVSGGKVEADGKTLLAAKRNGNPPFAATLPEGWIASLKVELFPHGQMGGSIVHGKKATLQVTATLTRQGGKRIPLTFRLAETDLKEPTYGGGEEVLGISKGWKLNSKKLTEPHRAYWLLSTPVATAFGDVLTIQIAGAKVDYLRLSYSPLAGEDPLDPTWAEPARVPLSAKHPSDADNVTLAGAYLLGTGWNQAAYTRYRTLYDAWRQCRGGRAWTMVTQAVKPATVRVLRRGNWQDDSGEIISPQVPHFLPQPRANGKRRLDRLDLARWLVSADNPLTARVVMNRLWKELFGQGISGRLDDLGGMGEWPTHPELLDWLAVEFRESGWDYKHMVRLLVLSNTYRQSANLRTELHDLDPQNRLLASQNPRRLEAEFVRDNALAIAGLLNREYGGPSAWPYQPAHYYENLQFPDRDYLADRDQRQYRRGVYMHWQRTFLHPMLANFDAPTREDCIASRNVANTPQQALALLNDPTFVEAARVFAGKLLTVAHKTDDERLHAAFCQALARSAKAAELTSLRDLLSRQRTYFRAQPAEAARLLAVGLAPNPPGLDPAEHAAWVSVCRTILNLHETITRY